MPAPSCPKSNLRELRKIFSTTARYRDRREVFRDLIFCGAAALRNRFMPDDRVEKEYLETIHRYEKPDQLAFREMFHMIQRGIEMVPGDFLGELFMDLEFGNSQRGQFFTPFEVSRLMAELLLGTAVEEIHQKGYFSLNEPACGSGGMILAVASGLKDRGYEPSTTLKVLAIDIDRTAALMCYIQLSQWNIPAMVMVGDTLRLEMRESWPTVIREESHSPKDISSRNTDASLRHAKKKDSGKDPEGQAHANDPEELLNIGIGDGNTAPGPVVSVGPG